MKKCRRGLALLLCLMLLLGMLPTSVLAADEGDVEAVALAANMSDIDFTDPASATRFEVVNQDVTEIREGEGLYLITTRDAFEPCNGQNSEINPKDVVMIPIKDDWTATMKFDFSQASASNGYYQMLGFYAAEGDDYQNLAGIRGGDGAFQNFLCVDGNITADNYDLNSAPGLVDDGTYWWRIQKVDTTYICYRSDDGEVFTEMFRYEDTGIEADSLIIDAYTGMTQGYEFLLKSLCFSSFNEEVAPPDKEDMCENDILHISVGETKTIGVGEGETVYIKFVPSTNAVYKFYSTSPDDTYGYLYDANMNLLHNNDDSGDGNNFSITYDFEAGEVYYWGVRYYGSNISGLFDVTLECAHNDNNNDNNNDYICDVCGASITHITVGETNAIEVNEGETVYIKFVPSITGSYKFYSTASADTCGYLYDANMNLLHNDDDSGDGYNFSITYDFEAGEVYYWGVRYYSSYNSGSFNVTLECAHNGEWETVTEASCESVGLQTCVCIQCGETVTEEIPKLDHNYELSETIPASCDEYGSEEYECTNCGDNYISEVSPLGHDYIYTTTQEATCSQKGMQIVTCSRCDYSKETETAKTKCIDNNNDYICDVCGVSISHITVGETKTIEVNEAETVYIEFMPTVSGTYRFYSTASSDTYGYLYDVDMNLLYSDDDSGDGNNFSIIYDFEAGREYCWAVRFYSSSTSGSFNVTLECAHNGEWETVTEASCESVGLQTCVCIQCGETVTEEIPKLDHYYELLETISATCRENQKSVYACKNCDHWHETHTSNTATGIHIDENSDNICDVCSTSFICGENLVWSLDENGTLTISGSGDMYDYTDPYRYPYTTSPWYADWRKISRISISEGVSSIGDYVFLGLSNIENVEIPGSVINIGAYAFDDCDSLSSIEIPDSIISIGEGAFTYCYNLTSITIHNHNCLIYNSPYTIYGGATIYGHRNSTAQAYAEEYGRSFIATSCESVYVEAKDATCTEKGNVTCYSCSVCGLYYSDESCTTQIDEEDVLINELGHNYGDWDITKEPTCTESGEQIRSCSRCGEIETEIVEAVGHTLGEVKKEVFPSCTESGYIEGTCSVCEVSFVEHVDALGHTYSNEWETAQELTCISDGIKVKACTVCGEKSGLVGIASEDLPKCTGTDYTHHMNTTFTYSVPGDCRIVLHFSADSYVESGYDYVYVYAGDSADEESLVGRYTGSLAETIVYIDASSFTIRMTTDESVTKYGFEISSIDYYSSDNVEIIPAQGHSYGTWEIVTDATCTTSGSKERTCENCDDKETEIIYSFGHSYGEWITTLEATCDSNGIQEKACNTCGNVIITSLPAIGHDYSLVDTIDYTCTERGLDIYVCGNCANERTNVISTRHRDLDDDGFCDFCNEPYLGVLDLVFVIDTTGSMGSEISVVKQNITNYANRLANSNIPYYIAVVDYRDFANRAAAIDYPYSVLFDFTSDNDEILSSIDKLSLGNGGDTKETVFSGLVNGLDELHWGENSVRKVMLIGDAAPLDPEPNTNLTLDSTCEYLNNNDISVYSISTGGNEVIEFAEIAEATGGESYVCSSDDAFNQVLTDIIDSIPESLHIHTYEVSYNDATCTQGGIITYHCTGCGKYISTESEPLGHDYSKEWTTDKEPTCTEDGSKSHHCTRCDDKGDITAIDAHGHDYESVITEPTCTEDGYTTHTCTICEDTYTDTVVDALGHNYGNWVVTKEPTCTKTGIEAHTCERCGNVETQTVEALGHDYSEEWTIDKEPTCTEDGSKSHHCARCDDKGDVTAIDAHGHDYESVITEPTCTEDGYTTHTCGRCGVSYKDSYIAALGHSYTDYISDGNATCTEDGTMTARCIRCDEVTTVTESGSALGHDYGVWTETVAAGCTTKGEDSRSCSRCGEFETRAKDALGHDYIVTVTAPTCTGKGFTTYTCSRCSAAYTDTYIDALGHSFGAWQIEKQPSCTSAGVTSRVCNICAHKESETIAALGHSYTSEVITPTCTERGYTKYTCSVCGHSYRDAYVSASGHTYGEWIIDKEATVLAEGSRHRECTVCSYTLAETIACIEIDIDTNLNYGLAVFTVVNAQTLEPINNARIFISTEKDGENTYTTDSQGQVSIVLPVGKHNASVYADGCLTRNINVNIKAGLNQIPKIGLSDRPTYEAKITSERMTYEEIIEAGIDVNAPGNQHVYKYELKLEFEPEIDFFSIISYFNFDGKYLGGYYCDDSDDNGGNGGGGDGDGIIVYPGSGSGGSGSGGIRIPNTDITIYPVSEYFYLIIRGEVSWLKEMFDVEMLIINNSQTDTMEDLTATLTLPDGLSLATMLGDQQTAVQEIDHIGEGQSETLHWYVRGDKAGSYNVEARLQGMIMPFEEPIDDLFKLENPIHVWAGNALHLHFEFPNAAYYDEEYPIRITLTNVSDITLYNVNHKVQIEQGMEIYHADGTSKVRIERSAWENVGVPALEPGDAIIIETTVNIFFESEIMQKQLERLIGLVDNVEQLIQGYKAIATAINATKALFNCVDGCIKALDEFDFNYAVDGDMAKLKLFQQLYNKISSLASSYTTSGNKTIDAALGLVNTGINTSLNAITSEPAQWLKTHSVKDINTLLTKVEALENSIVGIEKVTNKFDIFDSVRTAISAIPIRFALKNVIMTEDEDNTTRIPWSYTVTEAGPQYFGVSNVSKYLMAIVSAAMAEVYEDAMPGYMQLLPGLDDPFNREEAIAYIRATENEIAQFKAKDATGNVTFRAWVEKNSRTVGTADNFLMSCDNDTAEFKDGVLTFTGDGMISLTPLNREGGTLFVEDSEGNTYTYAIEVVEQHACTPGDVQSVIAPTAEFDGFSVDCCVTCGEIMEIIPRAFEDCCEVHRFGSWKISAQATCVEAGTEIRTCADCGFMEYQFVDVHGNSDISALDHTWDKGEIIEQPTQTQNGICRYRCEICGETKEETIPATEHTHDFTQEVTEPTCTEGGFTTYTCSSCGESYQDDVTEALGHDWDEGKVTTEPTQTDAGVLTYTCTRCGGTKTESIPAVGPLPTLLEYPVVGGNITINTKTSMVVGCDESVTSADIPASVYGVMVIGIDRQAFYNRINLKSVTLPDSVNAIGLFAFQGCSSLTSITLPDSVTTIGGSAFSGCSSLTSITIPDSVTTIGASAFLGCSSLTSITIPDGVTQIGRESFSLCSNLTSIMLPDSITTIGEAAFYKCSSLVNITIPGSVTTIDRRAFYGCSSLTSITIPDSITTIGYATFTDCRDLTSITLPDSLTTIGNSAFFGCRSLTSVTIPNGVTTIDNSAFSGCSRLTSVTIPNGVTKINSSAFSGCSGLTSIILPDGVTTIGDSAFKNCSSLASITIPDSVTTIGNSAFKGCSSLLSIIIPDSVTAIGESAFQDCRSLSSATISDNITVIGTYTFRDCIALSAVSLPDGIAEIGVEAFYDCPKLESIEIPNSVTIIYQGAFGLCTGLKSVVIPDSVTTIDASAFAVCSSLTNVVLSKNISSISEKLFYDCQGLTSIVIPAGVTKIDANAFYGCYRLKDIYYSGTEAQWTAIDKMYNDFSGITIHYGYSPDHEHVYTVVITAPTCVDGGYSEYTCICGDSYIADEVLPLGHKYEDVLTEPTCMENGYTTFTCIICGDSYVADEVPASGHSYEETVTVPTCVDPGYSTYTCKICSDSYVADEFPASGHNYEEYVIEPTCVEPGYTNYTCSACGDSYNGSQIAALGHSYKNGTCIRCDAEDLNAEANTIISVGDAKTMPGKTIVVPVSIEGNPGFAGYTFIVTCDDGLTLKDIKKGSLSQESDGGALTKNIAKGQVNWTDYTNLYGDGEILLLTFDVAADAADGDYGISIELKDNKATNFVAESGQSIGVRFENGTITVANVTFGDLGGDGDVTSSDSILLARYLIDAEELDWKQLAAADVNHDGEVTAADAVRIAKYLVGLLDSLEENEDSVGVKSAATKRIGGTQLSVPMVGGAAGETVTVPVSIAGNTGFAGFTFEISCDEELTLTDMEKGSLLKMSESGSLTKNIEKAQVNWTDSGNVYGDGELLLLTFEIAADADKDIYHASVKLKENKASNFVNEEGRPIAAAFDTKDASCPCEVFADSAAFSSWAHDGIDYCVTKGLMNGVGDGMFNPAGTLTRAQLVTILYRVVGAPAVDVKGVFADVPADAWYAEAVEWAAENEIVKGIGSNKFAPDAPITREQIATILYRYDGGVKVEGSLEAYPDADKVGSYAVDGMLWAIENEIITGVAVGDATYLKPQENATREQIAAIMMRYLEVE